MCSLRVMKEKKKYTNLQPVLLGIVFFASDHEILLELA